MRETHRSLPKLPEDLVPSIENGEIKHHASEEPTYSKCRRFLVKTVQGVGKESWSTHSTLYKKPMISPWCK